MDIDLGSLVIVGAITSLFVQWLKNKSGLGEYGTLATLIGISLVGGFIYQAFSGTAWWGYTVNSLVGAGAFYTFVIERFNKK